MIVTNTPGAFEASFSAGNEVTCIDTGGNDMLGETAMQAINSLQQEAYFVDPNTFMAEVMGGAVAYNDQALANGILQEESVSKGVLLSSQIYRISNIDELVNCSLGMAKYMNSHPSVIEMAASDDLLYPECEIPEGYMEGDPIWRSIYNGIATEDEGVYTSTTYTEINPLTATAQHNLLDAFDMIDRNIKVLQNIDEDTLIEL